MFPTPRSSSGIYELSMYMHCYGLYWGIFVMYREFGIVCHVVSVLGCSPNFGDFNFVFDGVF